jgi:hypothetical protein
MANDDNARGRWQIRAETDDGHPKVAAYTFELLTITDGG